MKYKKSRKVKYMRDSVWICLPSAVSHSPVENKKYEIRELLDKRNMK